MKAALIAQRFKVPGRLVSIHAAGDGNVNDTFMVIKRTTFNEERFVLQRINQAVFPKPDWVMENMRLVTEHCHNRLEEEAEHADRIWQLPRVIETLDGTDYFIDSDGEYWRAISLIASAHTYEKVQSLEHAHEAGTVLGQFQRLISNLSVTLLNDTLPGYHITPGYIAQLDTVSATPEGITRINSVPSAKECMKFIEKRRDWSGTLERAKENGEIFDRPIHGDPKVANIMIDDATGRGTAMIDLDTVKPGLIHYDLGDCMRSACNPAGEETRELSGVYFDIDLCKAIASGYMNYANNFLTDADRYYLYDCIRMITFELGARFFTDYVNGDRYFKVRYDGHNLNRALVQFKLCESIEAREMQIRSVLH